MEKMDSVSCIDLNRDAGEILLRAQRKPLAITNRKKVVAIILCIEDYKEMINQTLPKEHVVTSIIFHRHYTSVIKTAQTTPVLTTKHAKPVAVIISPERLCRALSKNGS